MNSESLTHDMIESESRTRDWTLRTTAEHPLPGREITARRRQSGVRRFLRRWRPTHFGRGTAVICLLTALCAGTVLERASLTRGNVADSHTLGNNTPETRLPGWGS